MRVKKLISMTLAVILFMSSIASAVTVYGAATSADVYVSENGNDGNAGTESAPVATVNKALELLENGGTIHVVGRVGVGTTWTPPNKDVIFTGDTLDFSTLSWYKFVFGKSGTSMTFEQIDLVFEMYSEGVVQEPQVFAEGCNLTMGEGVRLVNDAGEELAPSESIHLYAGAKWGNTVNGDTNMTILSGTYKQLYGGSNAGTVIGDVHLYVGGTVNNHADFDVTNHSGGIYVNGGGYKDTIGGSTYLTFADAAQTTHIFGGSKDEYYIGGSTNVMILGGKSMSCFGGCNNVQQNGNSNVLMLGGELEQLFGGCQGQALVGDVDVKVLGGEITRRVYGGCYNEYASFKWSTSYGVTGDISLTIGSGANISFSLTSESDRAIYAGSRYKSNLSGENSTIYFTDTAASDAYSGKLGAQDTTMKMIMSSVKTSTNGTHTHSLTYADDGKGSIVESCTSCEHSAKATVAIENKTRVYNGTAYEGAEISYDAFEWLGARDLTIAYANNVNAGTATASISYSGATASVSYEIAKASQTAPVLSHTNETILNKGDGTIAGLSTEMEYSVDGTSYSPVTDAMLTQQFVSGTYYVRYPEKGNYNTSDAVVITIAAGVPLSVTIPKTEEQVGYSLTTSATKVGWNDAVTLTYRLADGYTEGNDFAVKVNGTTVVFNAQGECVISDIQENQTITVEGIADITAPEVVVMVEEDSWDSFWNDIVLDVFKNVKQTVSIAASDINTGSGLDKTYYYVSNKELTLEEVKEVANWTEYKDVFDIVADGTYIVYAKAVDKAGNTTYVNSNGMILDTSAPVITGVTDGEAHGGDTTFQVEDAYLKAVYVDGQEVELEDGAYTIIADNEEHTISAMDLAGNSITYTITVRNSYTVTFMADGKIVREVTVAHGGTVKMIPSIPKKAGYDQTEPVWSETNFKNITSDMVITAIYQPNQYKVKFMVNDTLVKTMTVTHGSTITNAPKVPTKAGYQGAWDKALKNITNNMVVYAEYEVVPYTITYYLDGGINPVHNPDSYTVETSTIVLQKPTRAGYTFEGWYYDASYKVKATEIQKGTTGDITLYANWIKQQPQVPTLYKITYKLNGGKNNKANPTSYDATTTIALKNPTKKGYTFKGWYTDKKCKKKITQITQGSKQNYTLYAKWQKVSVKKVTLSFAKNNKSKKIALKYKKSSGATGYEISYSTDKKFKKTVKKKTSKSITYTIKSLKKGKTYYVRVRAYKLDSTGKKVYGKYSKVVKVKIKK